MIIDIVYGGKDDLSKGCLYPVLGWRPICWSGICFGPYASDLKILSVRIFILAKRILIDSQKNMIFYWYIFILHHQRLAKKKIGNWPNRCLSWPLKSPSERVSLLVSSIYVSFGHFSMHLTIKKLQFSKGQKIGIEIGSFWNWVNLLLLSGPQNWICRPKVNWYSGRIHSRTWRTSSRRY